MPKSQSLYQYTWYNRQERLDLVWKLLALHSDIISCKSRVVSFAWENKIHSKMESFKVYIIVWQTG
jgi:hypothetical protein